MGLLDPPGFRRNRHGQVWLHLRDADRGLLVDLLAQMGAMLAVHHEGRAVVSSGTREHMERDVEAMHGYGLWATMTKDD